VAVNLAVALMMAGRQVGLLDVDIHGPSIPTMLDWSTTPWVDTTARSPPQTWRSESDLDRPFPASQDDAIIWRGPLKMGAIKQFLKDVAWGDLDFLVIDSPPGTGDEPLSVCQLIGRLDGAVIVTTPQRVAAVDVRQIHHLLPPAASPRYSGSVEKHERLRLPEMREVTHIFRSGAGRHIASDWGCPSWVQFRLDPQIAEACDSGQAFVRPYGRPRRRPP